MQDYKNLCIVPRLFPPWKREQEMIIVEEMTTNEEVQATASNPEYDYMPEKFGVLGDIPISPVILAKHPSEYFMQDCCNNTGEKSLNGATLLVDPEAEYEPGCLCVIWGGQDLESGEKVPIVCHPMGERPEIEGRVVWFTPSYPLRTPKKFVCRQEEG